MSPTLSLLDFEASRILPGPKVSAPPALSAVMQDCARDPAMPFTTQASAVYLTDVLNEIRSSEHVLRLIVDNSPSMLAYWNRDLSCRFANRAYEAWFGVDPDGLIGTSIRDLLGPQLFELNRPYIEGVLAGEQQIFERLLPEPGGVKRHSLAYYSPAIADGEVVGFLVQVSDVSALKKAEATLQEAQRLGSIGSWEWLPHSDTTIWSAELYRIMGRDPSEPSPPFSDHAKLYTP